MAHERGPQVTVHLPVIAVTLGDPAGVGPEVAVRAALDPEVLRVCRPILVGERWSVDRALACLEIDAEVEEAPDLAAFTPSESRIGLLTTKTGLFPVPMSTVSEAAGKISLASIEMAVRLAMCGDVSAVVTAPVNKSALKAAGCAFPGHTELLGHLTGSSDTRMMLLGEDLRVCHNSTHVSLRRACDLAQHKRIVRSIEMFHTGLVRLGIDRPAIAVCGLNPHAGEGGLFGDEEEREIAPAIRTAVERGMEATGPYPADTVYARARAGEFSGVLAMYHDQGHIPVKTLGFQPGERGGWKSLRGVNVSLGLPIVRTSVDHGTAFEIAGKGVARHESMLDALLAAAAMAVRPASPGRGPSTH